MHMRRPVVIAGVLLLAAGVPGRVEEVPTFSEDVTPIFYEHCVANCGT